MPAPVLHEEDVMGSLFKSSGGGVLYNTKGQFQNHLYKRVKNEAEMETLWSLKEAWFSIRGSGWTDPLAYVCDDDATIVGYVMERVSGETLASMSTKPKWALPLADIIARVVTAMAAAAEVGIYPIVEHGGNVLVHKTRTGLTVSVVDVDGCVPWSADRTEAEMLQQLELVFLDFDDHAFYNKIFDTSSGDPKLWPALLTVDAILATCAVRSPPLATRVKVERGVMPVTNSEWSTQSGSGKSNCIDLTIDDGAVMPDCAGRSGIERELSQMLAEAGANGGAFRPAEAVVEDEGVAGAVTIGAGAATMDESGTGATTVSGDPAGAGIGLSAVPVMPSVGWAQQPLQLVEDYPLPTNDLDRFAKRNPGLDRVDLMLAYVASLAEARQLSQLVRAELTYLSFRGDECPLLFDGDSDAWFVHHKGWKLVKGSLTRVKKLLQSTLLPSMRKAVALAKTRKLFEDTKDGKMHPRMEFLVKTVACLECRESVEKLIKEAAVFFDREACFDADPMLFQCQNCILNLRTHTFQRSQPSDMCRRSSPITIPEKWLRDPTLIDAESVQLRKDAWATMWSLFQREGAHHPDDHYEELGDQDVQNFNFFMKIQARQLEGNPLAKLVMLHSIRGRNGKGMVEKSYMSVWGEYYTPVKSSVFHTDKRNENEHCAADIARRGARIGFGNETLSEPWSNAIFKSRNSTDPVIARGCGIAETVRFPNTLNFVFGMNDPPRWEQLPKGSEKDRIIIQYLPNKFIDKGTLPTSPRTYPKDTKLEEKIQGHDFALGHLLNLVQIRKQCCQNNESLDEIIGLGTSTSVWWLNRWMDHWTSKVPVTGGGPSDQGVEGDRAACAEARTWVEKVHNHYAGEALIRIQEIERTTFLPGSMRPGKKQQKCRADNLHEACQKYPYLLRRQFFKPLGFLRLQVDLKKFNELLKNFGDHKFGSFESWGVVFELRTALESRNFQRITGTSVDEEEHGDDEAQADKDVSMMIETVCLMRLKEVAAAELISHEEAGPDWGDDEDKQAFQLLNAYIARCEAEGRCYGIYCDLSIVYYVKFGMPGRRYPRGPALAKLKKRYRAAACDGLCFMVDQNNAVPSIGWYNAQRLLPNADERLPTWPLYQEHYRDWRNFMTEYASLTSKEAKRSITKIFGLGLPDYDVPFLWALALDVSIFKDAALRAPENKHLSSMFATRRNPEATRLFYSVSPEEDKRTQQVIGVYERDGLAQPSACIFDAAIMISGAGREALQERCVEAEKALGFKLSLDMFDGAYCIARLLLVSGRGRATNQVLQMQAGHQKCLYDAVSYIHTDHGGVIAPADGPFSAYDFNTSAGYDSQRGGETLWLTHCPHEDVIKLLSRDAEQPDKRRRTSRPQAGVRLVCWQPYDEQGHFFGLYAES